MRTVVAGLPVNPGSNNTEAIDYGQAKVPEQPGGLPQDITDIFLFTCVDFSEKMTVLIEKPTEGPSASTLPRTARA